jgi:putative phosphoesterase
MTVPDVPDTEQQPVERPDTIAVITDIHGNLPALQAALARIEELGIDSVFCGGDLVGYGPHPNEVCALISEREISTIYGNYDYAIARDLEDCGCAYVTPHDRELGQRSVEWTLAHTSQDSKDFMRGLPFDLHFPVGKVDVHLVHGSPRKVNEYLFEDKPARLYERLAAAERDPVLVFGHTHKPWVHEYGGVLFVNCGSVGKPKDGDPRGAFAVLRATTDSVDVSIERIAYDADAVATEVREAGLPEEFADKLLVAA